MKKYGYNERTIGNILENKAEIIGEKIFFLHKNIKVTYKEINENANKIANSLLNLGIKKGDKVCLLMANSLEFLYAWFGLSKIGAVMIPINIALKGNVLRHIIENSGASVIIVDKELLDRVAFIREEIKNVKTLIIVSNNPDEDTGLESCFAIKWFENLFNGSSKTPTCKVHFYDPISIIYTSGTTGPSKGALLSHAHFYFIAEQSNIYSQCDDNSVLYSCLPLFHANALMLSVLAAMLAEGRYAMGKKFSLTTFWDEIKTYKATHTNVLGSIFPLLNRQPLDENDAKNPLKLMRASPWMPEFESFEKRFDLKLMTGYGTTETGIVCVSPIDEKIRPGSCGKPLKAYDVRIFDDHDIELGPKDVGEIVVRGNEPYTQMDGYYDMPKETLKSYRNLWYHTGDFGYKDEDGYLYFVDRKKDALRRRGENISSFEVEEVINSHPKVAESAVVAIPSEFGEDDVKTAVVLKQGKRMTPEELIAFCEDRMAYFAVPRYVVFKDFLPKTATLRIEKYKLRDEGITPDTWDRERAGYKLKR